MKNKKRLLLCLCCAFMASTTVVGLASCGDRGNTSTPDDVTSSDVVVGFEGGEYYAGGIDEVASGANTLSLTSDGAVTLVIGGTTLTGTYKFENNTFNMTFADSTTAVAILSSGGITLTYNGEAYTFLEKTEYTVSFNVEGAIASTKTVINGRFVTPPADPVKEGNIFVGWYMDAEFKTPFSFASMAVTSDITLYARFVEDADQEFKITFMVDGEVLQVGQTVGGVVVELPTPEKEGSTFIGWWIGDEAGNTSTKYEGNILKENTYLIAVFDNGAPIVSVTATGITWTAPAGVNNSYIVTISLNGVEVDSTTTSMASYDFDFASAAPGEYKIEVTLNGNTGVATYKNKYLAAVSNYQIIGSTLVFNGVENATKYLISFECGSHVHTQEDNGNSTVYDFSACAMKVGGITFKIEAMADGWISSEFTTDPVEKNLSATMITVDKATEVASWTAVENATGYDVSINGTVVATNITATSFDLKGYAPGVLKIEVTAKAHGYNASTASIDYRKTSLLSPTNVKLQDATLTWDAVEGATGYVVKVNDKVLPSVNTNAYTLKDEDLPVGATSCNIQVKALGATADADSLFGDVISVQFGEMSGSIVYANGQVTWDPVLGAKGYEVQVNGKSTSVAATESSCALVFDNDGYYSVKVRCIKADDTKSNWVETSFNVYETLFDVSGGSEIAAVYAAEGDKIALPEAAKVGYNHIGWFNTPNGTNGIQYETLVQGAENNVIYAHWEAKKFIVKMNPGNGMEPMEQEVSFDQTYQLPVPELTGSNFGGWYTQLNGQGFEYADENGNSKNVWRDLQEVVLYADWIEVLTFVEVADEETGETGYEVMGGADVKSVSKIRIPESYNGKPVISIGAGAFENCGALTKLEMPDTIQFVDVGVGGSCLVTGSAFRYCYNLSEFEVYATEGGHTRFYEAIDGQLVYNNPNRGKELVFVSTQLGNTQKTYNIPQGVEVIPEALFASTTFEKVTIPSSVKEIAAEAFGTYNRNYGYADKSAYKLETIEFLNASEPLAEDGSNGLIIREYAFAGTYKMTEITLPARTLALPSEMATDASQPVTFASIFASCSILEKVNVANPETANACYYTSKDGMVCIGNKLVYCHENRTGDIDIPASVTTIEEKAFYNCKKITGVTIHGFVTSIGKSAFENCTGLSKAVFNGRADDYTIDIQSRAFYKCSGLTKLTLPANLGKLDEYAFGGSSALTDVTVNVGENAVLKEKAFGTVPSTTSSPSSFYVTTVHIGANVPVFPIAGVFGSEKLTNLTVDELNPNYMNDEYGVVYNKVTAEVDGEIITNPTEIVFCPMIIDADYVMPGTITVIGAEVFKGRTFKNVTISAKVTSIGASAFADCKYLESVTFANADAALSETNGLTIGANAFQNCEKLTTVALPVRLTDIGNAAFSGCKALDGKMVIPENVKTIGASAFLNCQALNEVELKGAKTEILTGSVSFKVNNKNTTFTYLNAFESCVELAAITVAAGNENYTSKNGVLYNKDVTELIYCPMACVGESKTEGEETLNVIEVPNTVKEVWTNAFNGAYMADKVVFLSNETAPIDLVIGARAFYSANHSGRESNLKSVILPKGITTIPMKAFEQCALTSITIPNTVVDVQIDAFYSSSSLETVIFEEGGTKELILGKTTNVSQCYGPFYKCTALKNINIPERTSYIGYYAFSGCTALESITVPASVTQIINMAFQNCKALTTVTFAEGSKLTELKPGVFSSASSLANIVGLPDTVKTIGSNAFGSTALTSFRVPAAITTLDAILKGLTTLETVTFAENSALTTIKYNAFMDCTSLKSISIPSTVQTIGYTAFKNCTSLSSVTFETNADGKIALKSIDHDAFANTALKEFILPETTAASLTLNYAMFNDCRYLTKVSVPSQLASLSGVFEGCIPVANLIIAEGNTSVELKDGIIYNMVKQEDGSFINTEIVYVMKDINTDKLVIPEGIESIATGAFAHQPSLVEVTLPSSIKSLGANAFENCYNLEKVTFAKTEAYADMLTAINSNTFKGCSSLKTIVGLPTTITSIGTNAFDGCSALSKIVLPENLKTIGGSAFINSGLTEITIPVGVTSLENSTFEGCTELTSVTFTPDAEGAYKFTTFKASVFEGCINLNTFVMPNSVTAMGSWSFASSGIKNITLSENLTTISSYAFQYATMLEAISIPDKVTKIDSSAFSGCTSLGKFNEETQKYGEVKLSAGLKSFGKKAFENCTSLTEITIPDLVTALDEGGTSWSTSRDSSLFLNCTALETVDLNNVVKIGSNAFNGCTALKNIDLSKVTDMNANVFQYCESLESIDISALKTPANYDFQYCTMLESVTFGNSLTKLGTGMFADCPNLTTLELPESLTSIASCAFQNCTGLTSINIPSKVTALYASLFAGCINLENVDIQGKITNIGNFVFKDCAKITEFIIPASVTSTALGNRIFEGTNITKIVLPKGYIKDWSNNTNPFAGCDTLEEILVEDGNARFEVIDGLLYDLDGNLRAVPAAMTFENDTLVLPEGTTIKDNLPVFAGNNKIKKLVLPESMTTIPQSLLRENTSIEEVVLGSQVTTLGNYAFYQATALKKVWMRNADGVETDSLEGITTMNTYAFNGATSFTSIKLPSTLTTLGSSVFKGSGLTSITITSDAVFKSAQVDDCANLTNVTILEGVTTIPANAFMNTGITSITFPSTLTSIGKNAFNGSALTQITIPAGVTLGENVFQNCADLAQVTIEEGVTTLPSYIFDGCVKLTSITLPASLTSIGNYAFQNTGLTAIAIPASVTSIGTSAFNGCAALTNVTMNEGLKTIGGSAFAGTALTNVVLPSTVTSIGGNAFKDVKTLASINIPVSVTSIGNSAFEGCTALSSITIPANTFITGVNAFAGWTSAQQINVITSERVVAIMWIAGWNGGAAKVTFSYAQA